MVPGEYSSLSVKRSDIPGSFSRTETVFQFTFLWFSEYQHQSAVLIRCQGKLMKMKYYYKKQNSIVHKDSVLQNA